MKRGEWLRGNAHRILLLLILAIGLFARVYRFGSLPGGINQDEAFAGYEAYSLLKTGRDSYGYAFPVYLTAWGTGMNALASYLMIPFIALFGLHTWVIRLPQLIVGCLSIPAAYLLMRRLSGRGAALFSALLVAIAPWHVMLCRWGLESNLLPGFLLFGMLFFVMGLERPRFYLLSALMYGLSLYSYAIIWPFLPLILAGQLLLAGLCGKLRRCWQLACAAAILFCMALPLLLFCCVNYLGMAEIRLPFLSVPKLVSMRTGDFHQPLPNRIASLARILILQRDNTNWNYLGNHGIFYRASILFFLAGLLLILIRSIRALRAKLPLPGVAMLGPQMAFGLLTGVLYPPIINRQNCLFLPMILTAAYGIVELCRKLRATSPRRALLLVTAAAYLCAFCGFARDYFTNYPQVIAGDFAYGLEEATQRALALGDEVTCALSGVEKPRLMYCARIDPQLYQDTARFESGEPRSMLSLTSFGPFRFVDALGRPDSRRVYLLAGEDAIAQDALADAGFRLEQYQSYCVAWCEES